MNQAEQKDPVFRLKGNLLAVTLLEVIANDLDSLQEQLAAKVASAPSFFNDTPLIIGLERLGDEDGDVDLPRLLEICRSFRLLPLAVRALRETDRAAATAAGLALLSPPGQITHHDDTSPEPASSDVPLLDDSNQIDEEAEETGDAESAAAEPAAESADEPAEADSAEQAAGEEISPLEPEEPPVLNPTKIVSQPVRGGQQIYARGGDLIVLSAVSPGAELIADGNIHVYGPMRGRAMAGASGNTEARIFIHQLTAELVSIAGCYRIAEDLRRGPQWGHPVAISLAGDVLNITRL